MGLDTMLAGACIALLSVLSSAGARGLVAEQTVKLSVHYESLCPDSIRFVTKQLYPSWKHFGKDILKVDLNPFGKANFTPSDGGSWDFTCQHGADECRGNKVQACILDKVSDPEEYVPLIPCLMDSEFPPDAAGECIASLGTQSVTVKEVEDCAHSDTGSSLLHDNGVRTKDLAQGMNNLTWVLCCKYLHGGDKCA